MSEKKPLGYWDIKENVQKEALKYKTKTEFGRTNGAGGAYLSARRNDWLDEVCSHMKQKRKPNGYYTYDKCKEIISNMVYLSELQGHSISKVMRKNGWWDELTKPLIVKRKTNWTKDDVYKIAKKYNHKVDFINNDGAAYLIANRRGWLDEVCSHMTMKCGWRLGESSWTKKRVHQKALQFKTRSKFAYGGPKGCKDRDYEAKYAYSIASKKGWLDEVCSHMVQNINDRPRYIYAAIWEIEKLVYVGLTQSYKDRFKEHLNNTDGIIYKTTKKYSNPKFKVLTPTPVKIKNAGEAEERWRLKYEELGYETINQVKTGSLGGYSRIWDYDSVKKEALKYTRRVDFQKNCGGASEWAKKNGVLDEIQSHMPIIMGRWHIFENVEKEAKKYRIRKEFTRGCRAASEGAYRNGWMDILFPKENLKMGDMGYWDIKENVIEVAKNFETKREFNEKQRGAYKSALRNGWMNELYPNPKNKINHLFW